MPISELVERLEIPPEVEALTGRSGTRYRLETSGFWEGQEVTSDYFIWLRLWTDRGLHSI